MDFGNIDLSKLLGLQGNGQAGEMGQPRMPRGSTQENVNPNMAPPANFWQGDKFTIGAPGLQSVQPGQAPPTSVAPPPPPPTVGQNPFNAQAYLQGNPDILSHYQNALTNQQRKQYPTPEAFAQYHYNTVGKNEGRNMGGGGNPLTAGQQAGPASPKIMPRGAQNINPLMSGGMGNSAGNVNPFTMGRY